MLDPDPAARASEVHADRRGRVAGRLTITADAVPRLSGRRERPPMFELYQLGGGADRYTLQVDAERGVLLEAVAFRGGEPFQRITTEQVAFDHAIDPERFRFAAPAGEEIQHAVGEQPRAPCPLAEAQQLAQFTVLVPDDPGRLGRELHVHRAVTPTTVPACVSINFRSDDGHQSVLLSQYASRRSARPVQPDAQARRLANDQPQRHRRQGPLRRPDSGAHRTRRYVRVPHLRDPYRGAGGDHRRWSQASAHRIEL